MHNAIDQTMNVGHRDVSLITILSITPEKANMVMSKKIRITIKSDSVKKQCSAFSEVWSDTNLCWNQVYSLHYSNMKTMSGLVAKSKSDTKDFFQDSLQVLSMTKSIIF